MSIEMGHLSDRTPAECYVYQYVATWGSITAIGDGCQASVGTVS